VDSDDENFLLIKNEIDRMSKIIDDLGIISRADHPGISLKNDPIWLNDVIYDEIDRFKQKAENKKVLLDCSELPSTTILGDENWIRILLSNLLDNAVRYTGSNTTVKIVLDQKDGKFLFSVADKGPGVNQEELKYLTKRFFRSPSVKHLSGSGLGLSIAQWVAENHGGTLSFKNSVNGGLVATWEFPA